MPAPPACFMIKTCRSSRLKSGRNAKTINFGLILRMGAQKLARELRVSIKDAQEFMTRYFEKFEVLRPFMKALWIRPGRRAM